MKPIYPLVPCLLAAVVAAGCRRPEAGASDPGPPAVQVVRPERRTITRTVEQPSFVVAYERSSVYPKMTAYIDKWNVDIGDKVKKGDVLARLFVPELVEEYKTKKANVTLETKRVKLAGEALKVAEADVKTAEAGLAEAKALLLRYQSQVNRWDVEVKRLQREVDRGVVSPQVLLESRNQLEASTAARDAAKVTITKADAELLSRQAARSQAAVNIEVAAANLAVAESEAKRLAALNGYLVLPAPFDGVVSARNANTFDFVLPATGDPTAMARAPYLSPGGAAPIYVVDRTDVVRVFVDIPEADANYVQPGTKASVLIRAFRDEPIPATVTRTSWALNVKSRTLRAEIDLPNTDSKILPGMYAYGTVLIERKGAWALPRSAFDYSGDKTFYWSHDYENGRALRTEVRTGASNEEWVEVLSRRLPGPNGNSRWAAIDGSESVIVGDLSILAEGEPVRLAEPPARQ
jgi:multidrug efflux pump subunit AcrA (membrane-fusion protein)